MSVYTFKHVVIDGIHFSPEYAKRHPSEEDLAVIDDWMKDCVGFLFDPGGLRDGRHVGPSPVGTCFVVFLPDDESALDPSAPGTHFLVTAKHVYDDLKKKGVGQVRWNTKEYDPNDVEKYHGVATRDVPLNGWIFHPSPTVDLAARIWIDPDPNLKITVLRTKYLTDRRSLTEPHMLVSPMPIGWPPKEGDEVAFIALVPRFYGKRRNFPAIRFGRIALVSDEPIDNDKYGSSDYFVIDVPVYPGNSGGPVWVIYPWTHGQVPGPMPPRLIRSTEYKPFPLGVLSSGWAQTQKLVKRVETEKIVTETYVNLEFALVTPIDKVVEMLRSDEARRQIEELKQRHAPDTPDTVPL